MSNRMTSLQFRKWIERTGSEVEHIAIETGYTVESIRSYARGYREPPVFWHLVCLGLETKKEIQRQRRMAGEQR